MPIRNLIFSDHSIPNYVPCYWLYGSDQEYTENIYTLSILNIAI
jgi:hypothetical protein